MANAVVIIPCYNEEGSIANLLHEIRESGVDCDTVVIDDGSRDRTLHRARQFSTVLRLPANLGIGGAVQTGLRHAHRNGYDYALQVDGDGQHPPSEIRKLFECMNRTQSNIVIGSRFIQRQGFQSTLARRVGIQCICRLIGGLTGQTITDPTSGFRLFDKAAIEVFSSEYPKDFPEPISLVVAHERGLRVSETPVLMRERQAGASSIAGLKTLLYMLRVSCYACLFRIRRYV